MPKFSPRELTNHILAHQAINLDEHILNLIIENIHVFPRGGGGGSSTGGTSNVSSLSDLSDVSISGTPSDGETLIFSATSSYQATLSPLNWNGVDYDEPGLGGSTTPEISYLDAFGNARHITADGDTFQRGTSTANFHVGLLTWTQPSTLHSTLYIPNGLLTGLGASENASGLQATLRALAGDASMTVDNFKSNYFTYNSGASYTFSGFTGFEQAGTVSVVSGLTTPPAIAYQSPLNKFVPGSNYAHHYVSVGAYHDNSDSAQSINNNTETTIDLSTNAAASDAAISVSATSITVGVGNNISGGHGIFSITDDSDALISTGVILLQHQNQDSSWTTLFAGTGGSLAFPFNADSTNSNNDYRIRYKQTSGGSVNVYARLDLYWAE